MTASEVLKFVNALIVVVGIPTLFGYFIYLGRKLQILDDLTDVRTRFAVVESRVNDLWADRAAPARSPRQLNDFGTKILNESGIKEIIEENKEKLLGIVKARKPGNAYDAEQVIMSVVEKLPEHCPEVVDRLKDGAFKVGASMDVVLLVGGVYLRNLIMSDLGFSIEEINNNIPPAKS